MVRYFGVFSLFLFIGAASANSILVYDVKATEKGAIAEVKKNADLFQEGIDKLADQFTEIIADVKSKIYPTLENFKQQLSGASGFFEDGVEKLTSVNIYKESCGILGFRGYVMQTYNLAETCVSELLRQLEENVAEVKTDTSKMTELFGLIEKGITDCKNRETDNEKIAECIVKEAKKAEEHLQSLSKVIVSVRKLLQPYEAPVILTQCVAEKSTGDFKTKVDEITTCLSEKMPGATQVIAKVQDIAQVAEEKIINFTKDLANFVHSYLKTVEDKLVPVAKNVDLLASKFQEATKNFITKMQGAFKSFWDTIVH